MSVDKSRVMNDSPEWRLANYVPDVKCTKCGHFRQKDSKFYPCLCDRVQALSLMVGKPTAKAIYESPYPKLSAVTKKPLQCYRLHIEDSALHSILKQVYFHGEVSSFRIITDQQIVNIWLDKGGEEENLSEDDKRQSLYSSLLPHALVIINIGVMRSKNSAAADVLADAINIRRSEYQPVWVWDKPSLPYNERSTCWGMSVLDVIQDFETIGTPATKMQTVSSPAAMDLNRNSEAAPDDNPLSRYGSGLGKKNNKKRVGGGKKNYSSEIDSMSSPIDDDTI